MLRLTLTPSKVFVKAGEGERVAQKTWLLSHGLNCYCTSVVSSRIINLISRAPICRFSILSRGPTHGSHVRPKTFMFEASLACRAGAHDGEEEQLRPTLLSSVRGHAISKRRGQWVPAVRPPILMCHPFTNAEFSDMGHRDDIFPGAEGRCVVN